MEVKDINDVRAISKTRSTNVQFNIQMISNEDNCIWEKRFNRLLCEYNCNMGWLYLKFFTPLFIAIGILITVFSTFPFAVIFSVFIVANVIVGLMGRFKGLRLREESIKALVDEFYSKHS